MGGMFTWIATATIHPEFKNMICIKCDNETFAEKPNAIIEQEFRGEQIKVKMTASACTKCGWTTITLAQADELRRLTADAYRTKHGLLTSVEIKALRQLLGDKSQREFAAFLGVGEASVKRWETWLVQDKGNDQLIRMKCAAELRQRELADSLIKSYVAQNWVYTADMHAAALIAYGVNVQPTGMRSIRSANRTKRSEQLSQDVDLEKESCITNAAHEELALAA
jgi:putative zinc finger/helix-turn-helix YgiT family protein